MFKLLEELLFIVLYAFFDLFFVSISTCITGFVRKTVERGDIGADDDIFCVVELGCNPLITPAKFNKLGAPGFFSSADIRIATLFDVGNGKFGECANIERVGLDASDDEDEKLFGDDIPALNNCSRKLCFGRGCGKNDNECCEISLNVSGLGLRCCWDVCVCINNSFPPN